MLHYIRTCSFWLHGNQWNLMFIQNGLCIPSESPFPLPTATNMVCFLLSLAPK